MSALNVSVSSHLVDEHYTCIWANEFYYKLIGYPKPKYEALFHNHADEYYGNNPEGWELLTQKVTSVMINSSLYLSFNFANTYFCASSLELKSCE